MTFKLRYNQIYVVTENPLYVDCVAVIECQQKSALVMWFHMKDFFLKC